MRTNLQRDCEIFGLPKTTDFAVISKRYRQLALKWHPDKWKRPEHTDEQREQAAECFQEAADIYARLVLACEPPPTPVPMEDRRQESESLLGSDLHVIPETALKDVDFHKYKGSYIFFSGPYTRTNSLVYTTSDARAEGVPIEEEKLKQFEKEIQDMAEQYGSTTLSLSESRVRNLITTSTSHTNLLKPRSKQEFIEWLTADHEKYPHNASFLFALENPSEHENCWRLIQAGALFYADFENDALRPDTQQARLIWNVVVKRDGVTRYVCEQLEPAKRKLTAICKKYPSDVFYYDKLKVALEEQSFLFYLLSEAQWGRDSNSKQESFSLSVIPYGGIEPQTDTQSLVDLVRGWMANLLCAYAATPDIKTTCELHYSLTELPEESELFAFQNQYIFLPQEGLFYVQSNNTVETVPIENLTLFTDQLNELTQVSDTFALSLTVDEVKTLITNNGGHSPWDFERMFQQLSYLSQAVFRGEVEAFQLINANITIPILDKIDELRSEGQGYVLVPLQDDAQIPQEGEFLIKWAHDGCRLHLMSALPKADLRDKYKNSYIFIAPDRLEYIDCDGEVREILIPDRNFPRFRETLAAIQGSSGLTTLHLSADEVSSLIGLNSVCFPPNLGGAHYKIIDQKGEVVSGVITEETLKEKLNEFKLDSFKGSTRRLIFEALPSWYMDTVLKITEERGQTIDRNPEKAIKIEQLKLVLEGIKETLIAEVTAWKEANEKQPQPMRREEDSLQFERMSKQLYKAAAEKIREFENKKEIGKHRNKIRSFLKGIGIFLWTVSVVGLAPCLFSKQIRGVWWNGVRGKSATQAMLEGCRKAPMQQPGRRTV